ncbi:diacylglycerol/lipid kinase family protein [Streptomyces sp. NPDC004690]
MVNETSTNAQAAVAALRRRLPRTRVVAVRSPAGLPAALDTSAQEAAVQGGALGVLGGDGSVNAAVRTALDYGLPLAVFPGGALNHFAAAAGLPSVADAAAALEEGEGSAVDVALIDEPDAKGPPKVFLNTFALGAYADLVHIREGARRWCGRPAATVLALSLVSSTVRPFTARVDGTARRLWLLFAGNGVYTHHSLRTLPARERLTSGQLDVRLLDADAWEHHGRLPALLAEALDAPHALRLPEQHLVPRLDLTGLHGIKYAYDGEVATAADALSLRTAPSALALYRPVPCR